MSDKIRKVVYNACYGGFCLSREGVLLGRKLSGDDKWFGSNIAGDVDPSGQVIKCDYGHIPCDMERHDEVLVKVVEELGEKASTYLSKLKVAEVVGPYRIDEYDGFESVETPTSYAWVD